MLNKPGSKTQVTVRVNADLVAFIDELVAGGEVSSRAAYFDRAGERERRHRLALRDLHILRATNDDQDELNDLAAWATNQAVDLD